jgi:hypothetical protein
MNKIFLALIFAIPSVATASDWFNLSYSSGVQVDLDRASISLTADGQRKAWVRYRLKTPQSWTEGRTYEKMVFLRNYKCDEQTMASRTLVPYDRELSDSPMDTYSPPVPKYQAAVPDSLNEIEMSFVCGYKIVKK